ncbi:RING finger protein 227 [Dromaius novaehollandiae]|uniref:RING finger protein 227 n=1 Tax=Dromaius novaehollandiae TaxID=8790 RepID=UPI00311D4E50
MGEEAGEGLECGVCRLPYDRGGRAPRRLGGGSALAAPAGRCGHALCTACARRLARGGRLTCPFCRAVTALRSSRRRPLPLPVDADLWHRLAARPPPCEDDDAAARSQSPWWRALARFLIGRRAAAAFRRQSIGSHGPEMQVLTLEDCGDVSGRLA